MGTTRGQRDKERPRGRQQAGDCVMPREGIFVRVLEAGEAKAGDLVKVL